MSSSESSNRHPSGPHSSGRQSSQAQRDACGRDLPEQLAALQSQVEQLSRENERLTQRLSDLEEQAVTDPLTGIFNRRAFDQELDKALANRRRYGWPCVLLLLDIDNLKHVNDSMGHDAGDRVLQHVARGMAGALRGGDHVSRIGGDEFAILMPGIGRTDAQRAVTRIRNLLDQRPPALQEKISLSIGAALLHMEDTADSVLKRADRGLYQAKRDPAQSVCFVGPDASHRPASSVATKKPARMFTSWL